MIENLKLFKIWIFQVSDLPILLNMEFGYFSKYVSRSIVRLDEDNSSSGMARRLNKANLLNILTRK